MLRLFILLEFNCVKMFMRASYRSPVYFKLDIFFIKFVISYVFYNFNYGVI